MWPSKADIHEVENLENGSKVSLRFKKTGGDCCFDCVSLFSVFLASEKCMKDGKIHGDGEINTDCGTAGYTAVRHNRAP